MMNSRFVRFLDMIIAVGGLFLLTPIMVIVWVMGYRETGSPVFIQERVGKGQKPFQLYKFRTMHPSTASVATHMVDANAVTRLGGFLRRTKLDELPQLINVIKGDMSFVGPRPCLFNQEALIKERESRGIFSVLPGITGLAQVEGVDMSTPEKLTMLDEKMIHTFSINAYFVYIIQTATGKGRGDRIQSK